MIITACNIENEVFQEGSLEDFGLFSYNEKDFIADGITKDTSAEEVLGKYPDLLAEAIASKEGMLWAQPTSASEGTFLYIEGTGANMEGLKKYFRNPAFLFLSMEEDDDERTFNQVVFVKVKETVTKTVAVSAPMSAYEEDVFAFIEEKANAGEISMKEGDFEREVELGKEIQEKKDVDFVME